MSWRPKTILITFELSPELVQRIAESAPSARIVTAKELSQDPALWREAEAVLTVGVSPERLREADNLRWIQTVAAGVDRLLSAELVARERITVTNASGIHAEPIAEHVFGFVLAFARRLPDVLALQREARWDNTKFRELPLLAGSTLGILGVGAIGLRVAQLAAAFEMRVVGLRKHGAPAPHVDHMYDASGLHALLGESHYVVNALPMTADTRAVIGAAELAAMRSDAVLINIGRGPTIDTNALVDALQARRIRGAGLDVTDPEPLPSDHPLWKLDNVIVTPHYSGGQPGYNERATEIFIDNLKRLRPASRYAIKSTSRRAIKTASSGARYIPRCGAARCGACSWTRVHCARSSRPAAPRRMSHAPSDAVFRFRLQEHYLGPEAETTTLFSLASVLSF